ncbi:MAG: copper transporter [Coriobacteriia bacterium]|nr:copper transporter [Coriobacteriia bacterium]
MYNLRYHIASLVVVFFALAVGLLLGTVVAERGMLDDQGVALVQGLQTRFDEISAKNEELEAGLERDRAFATDVVGPLTAEKLSGMNIAIISPPDGADTIEAARVAVEQAGGTAITVTLGTPALGLEQSEPEGLAGLLQLQGQEIASPGEDLVDQVADVLAAEWREGDARPLTELLVTNGLMAVESAPGTVTIDAVVVVGGEDGTCDPVARALARRFVDNEARAVGVELSLKQDGVAATCSGDGLPAVDHLAMPQGRYSFIAILAGLADGYYGTGEDVDGFYPPMTP